MARYSRGFTSAAAATAAALASIKTAASERARIWEIGIFQPGTGTPTVVAGGIGKAANSGSVAGTAQLGQADDEAEGAATVNVYSVWTTAPTVPAAFKRRFSIPAVLGAGIIFTFPLGLVIPVSADYCICNDGGNTSLALNLWMTWDE